MIPKRIVIAGPSGAGKSQFSKRLAIILTGYIVYSLDDYYWEKNWSRLDNNEWIKLLDSFCKNESWIMDGNHLKTFNQRVSYADLVIILDYSPIVCLFRFLKRSIKRYFRLDDSLPKNILNDPSYTPKISIRWHLIKLILFYRHITKPLIIENIKKYGCKTIILKNDQDANNFLHKINKDHKEGIKYHEKTVI